MAPHVIVDRYELVQQIGQGAMGQIWEAFDRNLRRRVAVKVMSSTHLRSPTSRARFEREARAIAALHSPHVVQVFDAGIHNGSPYIVMELLVGEDLQTRLDRVERLPVSALVPIVSQAARALMAAQSCSLVHRDLKPANVFLARGDAAEETVKILDFGVVSMLGGMDRMEAPASLTREGSLVGTPMYMSPEQIRCDVVDHRSDLWSLAVLLYRALTGKQPFQGDWLGDLVMNICSDTFPAPSTVVPGLAPAVDAFFIKALAKDPDKRFPTAAELSAAFASLAGAGAEGPAKILLVDDEPDVATLIKKRFRKQIQDGTYDFVFAYDGEGALGVLRERPDIDVVLTDINMPRMDGLTLLSHLGQVSRTARAVVVSAYSEMSNIRTAMNRGAFDFLMKPIDFKDLAITIDKTAQHVRDLRRSARSSEENSLLRMFVSPRAVDRARAGAAAGAAEAWMGTVAVIGVGAGAGASDVKTPEESVRTLNANFEVIIPALTRREGVLHRFVGGAVMAVFRGDNHLTRALDACLDIRAQLAKLASKTGERSPFALGVSVGVATGGMIAGEIGSRAFERVDDSLLGEVPRAAVLLQAAAKENQVLVSAATYEATQTAFDHVPAPDIAWLDGHPAFELVRRRMDDAPGAKAEIAGADTVMEEDDRVGASGVREQVQDPLMTLVGDSSR